MKKRWSTALAAMAGTLLCAAAAGASTPGTTTLGVTSLPASASPNACEPGVLGPNTSDSSTPFAVTGGGEITQWQTSTALDDAGSSITLVVLRPTTAPNYTVVGTDTETIPSPLPASGIASFTLAQPIAVATGDVLSLFSLDSNDVCFVDGTGVPAGDSLFVALPPGTTNPMSAPPTTGQALAIAGGGAGVSPSGYELNLAATLVSQEDAGVQTSAAGPVGVGGTAVLASVVTNAGPANLPITFTDQVPAGLVVQSAFADDGLCATTGQTVTCTITGLPVGKSANVNVLVTASAAGSYSNQVSVSTGAAIVDPASANNTASNTVTVTQFAPQCIVPTVTKFTVTTARAMLIQLGCTVSTTTKHSSLAKGLVISTPQAPGTYPLHQLVTLVVSSGPKPKKHKKHRKHRKH